MTMNSSSGSRSLLKEKKPGGGTSSQDNNKKDVVKYRKKESNKSLQQEPENHQQRKSALFRFLHRDKKKTPELPEHGFMPDSRRVFEGAKSLTLPQNVSTDLRSRWSSYEPVDFSLLASPGKSDVNLEEVDLLKGTTGQLDNSSVSQRSLSHESITTLTSSDNYSNSTDQQDTTTSDPKLINDPVSHRSTHLKTPTNDKDIIREKIKQTDEQLNEALKERKKILEKIFEFSDKSPLGNPDINSLLFNSFMSLSRLTSTFSKSFCDGITNCQDSRYKDGVKITDVSSIKDVVLNLQKNLYLLSEKLNSDVPTVGSSSPPPTAFNSSSISAHSRDFPTDPVQPDDEAPSSQLSSEKILLDETETEQVQLRQDPDLSFQQTTTEVEDYNDNNYGVIQHGKIPSKTTEDYIDDSFAIWDSFASPTHLISSVNSVNIKLPIAFRRPTILPDNLQPFDASKILFRRDKLVPLMCRSSSSSCFSDLRIHSSIAEEDEEEEDTTDIQPVTMHPVTAPPTTAPPIFCVDNDDNKCTKELGDTSCTDEASELPLSVRVQSDSVNVKEVNCNEIEVENLSLFISEVVDESKKHDECYTSSIVEKSCDEENNICVDDSKYSEDSNTADSEPGGDGSNQPKDENEDGGVNKVVVDDSSTVSDRTNHDVNSINFNGENDKIEKNFIHNMLKTEDSATTIEQCCQGDGDVSCQEKVAGESFDASYKVEDVLDINSDNMISTGSNTTGDQENSYDNLNICDNKNNTDIMNYANEENIVKNAIDGIHASEDAIANVDKTVVESKEDRNECFVQLNLNVSDHDDDDKDVVDHDDYKDVVVDGCGVGENNFNQNNSNSIQDDVSAENDLADDCELKGGMKMDEVDVALDVVDEDRVRNTEACGSFGESIDDDEADDGSGNALSSANDEVSTPDDHGLVSCLVGNCDEEKGRMNEEENTGVSNLLKAPQSSSAAEISSNKKGKARKRKKKKNQQQNVEKSSVDSKSLKDICKNKDSSNTASVISR